MMGRFGVEDAAVALVIGGAALLVAAAFLVSALVGVIVGGVALLVAGAVLASSLTRGGS
jgi:membrane-bound ClpP family serine protease